MKPLTPVSPGARVALGVSFFVVFVAVWAVATLGGFVSKTFLADPITMVKSGVTLITQMGFAADIGMTVWRVLGGFIMSGTLAPVTLFVPGALSTFAQGLSIPNAQAGAIRARQAAGHPNPNR